MPDLPTRLARKCFERMASRSDIWATHGLPGTTKELAIIEEITAAIREALAEAENLVPCEEEWPCSPKRLCTVHEALAAMREGRP